MYQKIKSRVLWVVLITLLALTGIWQTKVTLARELQAGHKPLSPPSKTRAAIRPPTEGFTGDVVEDYIARCNKGLTDQEIGWIVADFRNAGLETEITGATSPEQLLKFRRAQYQWYQGALVDGLRLSRPQSSQSAAKLTELFDHDRSLLFRSRLGNDPEESGDASALFSFAARGCYWLTEQAQRFAPWKLCPLTSEQQKITWKQWFDAAAINDSSGHPKSIPPKMRNLSSASVEVPLLLSEPSFEAPEGFLQLFPHHANYVFPFIQSQKVTLALDLNPPDGKLQDDAPISDVILTTIRHLHPAQLKILLMVYPQLAEDIQSSLDNANR